MRILAAPSRVKDKPHSPLGSTLADRPSTPDGKRERGDDEESFGPFSVETNKGVPLGCDGLEGISWNVEERPQVAGCDGG